MASNTNENEEPSVPETVSFSTKAAAFVQRRRVPISLGLVLLLGLLSYSNTIGVPFVFDDDASIVSNTAIRSFHGLISDWRYPRIVGSASFAVNYSLGELNVTGYHVFNLAVHLINALLVFAFVSLLFKTPFFKSGKSGRPGSGLAVFLIVLFSSLLFVVHPVQTGAVTYVVQRFTSLSTMFCLLSLVFYLKWRLISTNPKVSRLERFIPGGLKIRKALLFFVSLLTVLLAMGTKETAFTLPIVMIVLEFSFFNGNVRKRMVGLIPFIFTMISVPIRLLGSDNSLLSASGGTEPAPARIDYLLTQFRVIVTYLRLLVLPVGQNLDYDYPIYKSIINPSVFLSLVLLLVILGMGVYLFSISRKKTAARPLRLVAFGIFWFFITLSVESSVIPIQDVIFEHRLYMPSIGLIVSAVTLIVWSVFLVNELRPVILKISTVVELSLLVLIFAGAAHARNNVWHDPATLWSDTARKSPGKARPHNNLGVEYQKLEMFDRAQKEFELAVFINPDYAEAHYNLGNIYGYQGRYDEARAQYREALRINPDYQKAKNNIQLLPQKKGT